MLAISWVMVQVLFGGATVWENGKLFGGPIQAKKLWKYHRCGYTILQFIGDSKDWFRLLELQGIFCTSPSC